MTEDTSGESVEASEPTDLGSEDATETESGGLSLRSFPVVGIGASAGGLESIEQFFRDLDDQANAAFVVIQHLSPDFKSFMPEILSKKTRLKVLTATDGMPINPNTIYLMPPRMNMVIKNYTLHLSDIERTRIPNKPIDLFFTSLARDVGAAATAVVLSGTGSDGAFGIKEVHQAGGDVYVESMASAKFDGMPSAAIATGVVTSEGTPRQLAAEIFGLAFDDGTESKAVLKKELMGSRERVQIFNAIESRYGVDFARYKIATVNRRIDRRMSELNLGGIEQYWRHIQDHPQEVTTLYYEMLIGVTDFFRDPDAFQEVRREIIRIVESKHDGDEIRLWSAGCASGEEIYSLGMLFLEEMKAQEKQLNLKIFATDIDDEILGRAATGVYQEEEMASIPADLRRTYFTQQSGAWKVTLALRSCIVFARHNVMNDPPFTKLDMIVCRNLLIYLDGESQKQVLSLFYFSLNPNGLLFLGPSESLGKYETGYDTIHTKWKIFSKSSQSLPSTEIGGAPAVKREFPIVANPLHPESRSRAGISRANSEDAYQALLEQFVPPSLLIDENQNLLHVYGELPVQLSFKSGKVSNSLRSFLDENLCTAISVCVQRAKRDRLPVEYTRFRLQGDSNNLLDFKVIPVLPRSRAHVCFFLVSLAYRASEATNQIPKDAVVDDRAVDLEQVSVLEEELQNTKEHLQATIEELETTNEELQSTNEELLASNEQLQSTNEELHSVNEELHINRQLIQFSYLGLILRVDRV
ncbi:MAG: CheR family methyltransferase, partial [Pseudomonadota bacterium]